MGAMPETPDGTNVRHVAEAKGVDAYLQKPFCMEMLVEKVQEILPLPSGIELAYSR